MLGERYLGGAVETLTYFGPSLAMFVLTLCSVDSLRKLRVGAPCIVLLSLALVLQGAAAYHFGYNTNMFLFDPATRAEYDPTAAADDPEGYEDAGYTPTRPMTRPAKAMAIRPYGSGGWGFLHDPNDLTAHNSFVLCFAETGLIGLLLVAGAAGLHVCAASVVETVVGRATS
jgi:hypothetical protein